MAEGLGYVPGVCWIFLRPLNYSSSSTICVDLSTYLHITSNSENAKRPCGNGERPSQNEGIKCVLLALVFKGQTKQPTPVGGMIIEMSRIGLYHNW